MLPSTLLTPQTRLALLHCLLLRLLRLLLLLHCHHGQLHGKGYVGERLFIYSCSEMCCVLPLLGAAAGDASCTAIYMYVDPYVYGAAHMRMTFMS